MCICKVLLDLELTPGKQFSCHKAFFTHCRPGLFSKPVMCSGINPLIKRFTFFASSQYFNIFYNHFSQHFFCGNADFRSWSGENTHAFKKSNNFCYGLNGYKYAAQICLGQDRIPLSWGPNDSDNKKKRGKELPHPGSWHQSRLSQGIYSLEVCGGKSRAVESYGDGWKVTSTPSGESWTIRSEETRRLLLALCTGRQPQRASLYEILAPLTDYHVSKKILFLLILSLSTKKFFHRIS